LVRTYATLEDDHAITVIVPRPKGPVPVFVIAAAFVNDPRWVEAGLHQEFAACRLEGEWFALDQRSVADVIRLLVDAEMTGV
jgi:hypothetical protein